MIRRTEREITVSLASGSYTIHVDSDWLSQLGQRHRTLFARASSIFLIADSHVGPLFAGKIQDDLEHEGFPVQRLEIPAGENSKSLSEASRLWESLLAKGADRRSLVLALGGGVVGDLAGFVAATYARGISYAQIPTTLVAQIDSSIGGKVGINLATAKNMVGCFWQPVLVAIDVGLLTTLPTREYTSGWAEVVKYGMTLDAELFEYLETHAQSIIERKQEALAEIVRWSCALKAQIVMEDERDVSGRRTLLNYGHTFGHAIEVCSGYGQWLHGEAVAMGMHHAARLAQRIGWIDQELVNRQAALLQTLNLPISFTVTDAEPYLQAMAHDKKTERSAIRCVLPTALGKARLSEPMDPAILSAIWKYE